MRDSAATLDLGALDGGTTIHIGRYALHRQIARGGMATIHIARLMGDEGFSRIVAAKDIDIFGDESAVDGVRSAVAYCARSLWRKYDSTHLFVR